MFCRHFLLNGRQKLRCHFNNPQNKGLIHPFLKQCPYNICLVFVYTFFPAFFVCFFTKHPFQILELSCVTLWVHQHSHNPPLFFLPAVYTCAVLIHSIRN